MKFKFELLEGELGWKERGEPKEGELEIFNTEENELSLRSGNSEYILLKSALQIGMNEIFLYGWLKNKDDVFKVRYKLKPIKL